jgi:hypothetical protein
MSTNISKSWLAAELLINLAVNTQMAGEQPGKHIVYVARSSAREYRYGLSFVKWFLGLPVGDIQNRKDRCCSEDTFVHNAPPK